MADGPCVLVCRVCSPDADMVIPFSNYAARGRWAAEHTDGTGHASWLVLDQDEDVAAGLALLRGPLPTTPREALDLVTGALGGERRSGAGLVAALSVLRTLVEQAERTASTAAGWVQLCDTAGCSQATGHQPPCDATMADAGGRPRANPPRVRTYDLADEIAHGTLSGGLYPYRLDALVREGAGAQLIPLDPYPDGSYDPRLPHHLRGDAPMVACSVCSRRSVMLVSGHSIVGTTCAMTQPSGARCDGVFEPVEVPT